MNLCFPIVVTNVYLYIKYICS